MLMEFEAYWVYPNTTRDLSEKFSKIVAPLTRLTQKEVSLCGQTYVKQAFKS